MYQSLSIIDGLSRRPDPGLGRNCRFDGSGLPEPNLNRVLGDLGDGFDSWRFRTGLGGSGSIFFLKKIVKKNKLIKLGLYLISYHN